MPRPSNPPPSNEPGAVMQPRQLQRWLDVNPIHALTRAETFINVPVFSVNYGWQGYSDIVAVFNFTAQQNFSLKAFTVPVNPNYLLCVTWVDEDNVVHRYKLWENVGEVIFAVIPLYTNQLIKKNFRFEIWSVRPMFISFAISNAGTALVNGTYAYNIASEWSGPGAVDATLTGTTDGVQRWKFANGFADFYIMYVYPNQVFPFGLWSTTEGVGSTPLPNPFVSSTASQAAVLPIYTSVLQGYDYRYADDAALSNPGAIVTDFSVVAGGSGFDVPMIWPPLSVPTVNT